MFNLLFCFLQQWITSMSAQHYCFIYQCFNGNGNVFKLADFVAFKILGTLRVIGLCDNSNDGLNISCIKHGQLAMIFSCSSSWGD